METIDLYQEHFAHDTFEEHCSDCFKENRILQARKIVNGEHKASLCFCGKPARTPNSILCAECNYKSNWGIE